MEENKIHCIHEGTLGPGGVDKFCHVQQDYILIEKCNENCFHFCEDSGGQKYLSGRISRVQYFIEIAQLIAKRSSCKSRQVGCVIIDKYSHIKATGYNGPPVGFPHCEECYRVNSKSGQNLYQCLAVHAEMNALLQCGDNHEICSIYITDFPCEACAKMICNTTISEIHYIREYGDMDIALKVLRKKGIALIREKE